MSPKSTERSGESSKYQETEDVIELADMSTSSNDGDTSAIAVNGSAAHSFAAN
jgi:hypothetical protein